MGSCLSSTAFPNPEVHPGVKDAHEYLLQQGFTFPSDDPEISDEDEDNSDADEDQDDSETSDSDEDDSLTLEEHISIWLISPLGFLMMAIVTICATPFVHEYFTPNCEEEKYLCTEEGKRVGSFVISLFVFFALPTIWATENFPESQEVPETKLVTEDIIQMQMPEDWSFLSGLRCDFDAVYLISPERVPKVRISYEETFTRREYHAEIIETFPKNVRITSPLLDFFTIKDQEVLVDEEAPFIRHAFLMIKLLTKYRKQSHLYTKLQRLMGKHSEDAQASFEKAKIEEARHFRQLIDSLSAQAEENNYTTYREFEQIRDLLEGGICYTWNGKFEEIERLRMAYLEDFQDGFEEEANKSRKALKEHLAICPDVWSVENEDDLKLALSKKLPREERLELLSKIDIVKVDPFA